MDTLTAGSGSAQVPLGERDVGKAAAEFLASSSERRKRGRPASVSNGSEPPRKRPEVSKPQAINLDVARKAAESLIRDSPSYQKLVKVEEALDLAITRKQHDIKDTLRSQPIYENRIFRLYLFNTYRSQPGSSGITDDDEPSWSLRIQGKLLPKVEESVQTVPNIQNTVKPGEKVNQTPSTNGSSAMTPMGEGVPILQSSTTGTQAAREGSNMHSSNTPSGSPLAAGASSPQSIIQGPLPKCSDVFKRIVIELDKELYPENNLIEWKRNDKEASSDGFEISRSGSKEFTAKIYLYVDHRPEHFRLSYALSRLIGVRSDTRKGIFAAVWQYVKKMRLQCVDDRAAVRLDSGLRSLLGPANQSLEVLKLEQLFAVVKSHMGPLEPLVIDYQISLSGDVVENQDCYDIRVSVQDMTLAESARNAGVFGLRLAHSAEFEALNERHMIALERIAHHKKRRDFFQGFCSNPVQFINHLILSQTRDLKVLGGSTGRNPEEERKAAFYQQQWVHEAVPRYLLRKAIADTAEDTIESGLK